MKIKRRGGALKLEAKAERRKNENSDKNKYINKNRISK
jgi:hypothetical protein